ncbi:hypothetical protein D3C83_112530 [compost metagenome]
MAGDLAVGKEVADGATVGAALAAHALAMAQMKLNRATANLASAAWRFIVLAQV